MEAAKYQKPVIASTVTQKTNTEHKQNATVEATTVPDSEHTSPVDINTARAIDRGIYPMRSEKDFVEGLCNKI